MTFRGGINAFFEQALGARVGNPRWSWGAYDERNNRVFLRLWEDEILAGPDGAEISVLSLSNPKGKPRPGWTERVKHLEAMADGASGFGVVCEKGKIGPDSHSGISSFDSKYLLKLGQTIEQDGRLYAKVTGVLSADALNEQEAAWASLPFDIETLITTGVDTSRQALVDARLGQGRYRTALLALWGNKCAVTGCRVREVIRASHVKPWKLSSDSERLDPYNGIPLIATLDALFDSGLISFDDEGRMLVSGRLDNNQRELVGVPGVLSAVPGRRLRQYLAFHREMRFRR